jgi:hypothetical protein
VISGAVILIGYGALIGKVGPWALLPMGVHIIVMLAACGRGNRHGH